MMRAWMAALGVCLTAMGSVTASAKDAGQDAAFERFVGEWKLKNDAFQQVWDGETVETLSIPGHRTVCEPVNTSKSILCRVDAVDFQGHILWAVQDDLKTVSHLSHFGTSRLGDGAGELSETGDLALSIKFSDEPAGTYRVYQYRWVSRDEYSMMSRQYDADGTPTGNWYGGSFVRVGGE
ncbi:MAG: hypothetical protein AAGL68_05980 [Pseudomonadota bacterium]